jgi:predicted DNA-binding transcriptional regulator YafY
MSQTSWPYGWDLLTRYRLIETVALWEGRLTTNHLCHAFGIGRQQASKDINAYNRRVAPGNLEYDTRLKGYRPSGRFTPRVTAGLADEYLQLLNRDRDLSLRFESLGLQSTYTEVLAAPVRSLRPEILRPLLEAARESLRVECEYVSFSNPDPEIRVIQPHTLVFTGMRWHLRAYCEKNRDYRDFVLSRFRGEAELMDTAPNPPDGDTAWNTQVAVRVVPDPRLDPQQRSIIEQDYGMQDGALILTTRGALVQYLLQLLHIDLKILDGNPAAQQIVVENRLEVARWTFA